MSNLPKPNLNVPEITRQKERMVSAADNTAVRRISSEQLEDMSNEGEDYAEYNPSSEIRNQSGIHGGVSPVEIAHEMYDRGFSWNSLQEGTIDPVKTWDAVRRNLMGPQTVIPPRVEMEFVIFNLTAGTKIDMVVLPDELTDNSNANFNTQIIPGRSLPYYGFQGSGPRQWSFTVTLHDDLLRGTLTPVVRQLYALQYPLYKRQKVEPPKCLVIVGSFLRFTAIPTSIGVTWKKPLRDTIYATAEVSFQFSECTERPFGADDIENLGWDSNYLPPKKEMAIPGEDYFLNRGYEYWCAIKTRMGQMAAAPKSVNTTPSATNLAAPYSGDTNIENIGRKVTGTVKINIQVGHLNVTGGQTGAANPKYGIRTESDMNLQVARGVASALEGNPKYSVVIVDCHNEAVQGQNHPSYDLFLSLHMDSDRTGFGVGWAVGKAVGQTSKNFAKVLIATYGKSTGLTLKRTQYGGCSSGYYGFGGQYGNNSAQEKVILEMASIKIDGVDAPCDAPFMVQHTDRVINGIVSAILSYYGR